MAKEAGLEVTVTWRNARRGHGAVVKELKQFLRDLQAGRGNFTDLVLVGTDANSSGYSKRRGEMIVLTSKLPAEVVFAIPDPHVERWMLIDSAAFKAVFGRGCEAPDLKHERARYKKQLIDAIRAAGSDASLGGMEYADDIVAAMDIERARTLDASFGCLVDDLRAVFRRWQGGSA